MTVPPKTPKRLPRAATPLSPAVPPANDKGQAVGRMPSVSAELSSCGSRKRRPPQSFDPAHVQHRPSSQKQRPSGNTPAIGLEDRVASLKPSIPQSKASTKPKACWMSAVAKSQLGQTNTSPAMQPQSGLIKEMKTEIEDVAPDSIQGGTSEGFPPRIAGVQGTIVSPSIKEEGRTTSGARCDHKTKKNADPSNQPTCSIDSNFLQQVVVAFEEVNANQKESTRLAKESISMNSSLEPTFLAIREKHGNITKDCPLESGYMLTSVLEVICKVVQELQKKRLTEVDRNLLDSYYLVVKDAEKMKVNVNWLRTRLDEIKDAINCIVETKKINDEMNRLAEHNENEKKNLESMKVELEKLKSEIDRKESQLNLETLLTEELSSMICNRALRIQQFQNMPLMEAFP